MCQLQFLEIPGRFAVSKVFPCSSHTSNPFMSSNLQLQRQVDSWNAGPWQVLPADKDIGAFNKSLLDRLETFDHAKLQKWYRTMHGSAAPYFFLIITKIVFQHSGAHPSQRLQGPSACWTSA